MGNFNCVIKKKLTDDNFVENKSNIILAESSYDVPEHSLKTMFLEGKAVNVYDGDTIHIVFFLNNKLVKYNCRLLGIDSPEICPKNVVDKIKREQEISSAIKSRNYLIFQLTGQTPKETISKKEIKELCTQSRKLVYVKCYDFDKYGRLLVEIFLNKNDTISINKQMIINKFAVEYDGGTKKEFKPSEIVDTDV